MLRKEVLKNFVRTTLEKMNFNTQGFKNFTKSKHPAIFNYIIKSTEQFGDISYSERLYCFLNDVAIEYKKCPICQKKNRKYFSLTVGYSDTCSNKCRSQAKMLPRIDITLHCIDCKKEKTFNIISSEEAKYIKKQDTFRCRSCAAADFRKTLKHDEDRYSAFIEKTKNGQTEVWKNRTDEEKSEIFTKSKNTINEQIGKMSKEERSNKFSWMNKLNPVEKEEFIKKLHTKCQNWWENIEDKERDKIYQKKKLTWLKKRKPFKELTQEDIERYDYYKQVSMLTEINYEKYKHIINPNHLYRRINSYHLDHIFSIAEGFKQKIPAEIIASVANLQMLECSVNIKKRAKCWITKEQLLEDYEKGLWL
ncbi:MAG TPA: hypothetical protein PLA71_00820 [Saccharofermentans sp.]|nr:hypothetical protein [Saccharofermentans sp.]